MIPRAAFSPEENARIIGVCMRPRTPDAEDDSTVNPLLTELQKTVIQEHLGEDPCSQKPDASTAPKTKQQSTKEKATDEDGAQPENPKQRESYALAIEEDLEKGAVPAMASRYITNLFACKSARAVGEDGES